MNVMSIIKSKVVPAFTTAGRKIKKNSPEILLGAGIVSIVAGTIAACKATLKVNDILEEQNETVEKIEESVGKTCKDGSTYTEEDKENDMDILKKQTIVKIGKKYIIPAILVLGGIALTIASHGILKDRYLTLVRGYNSLMAAYNMVKAERDCAKSGIEIVEEDENPSTIKEIAEPVSEIFDESCPAFKDNNMLNASFLKGQLRSINHTFQNTTSPILLNDVFDILKMPRTKLGAQVGWAHELGNEYISFGEDCDRFIEECSRHEWDNIGATGIWLNFNVGGSVVEYL